MANTFIIVNNSSGTISVCGENVPAGGSEDVRLDRLVDDPDCTEELAFFVNNGDISITPPSLPAGRLSIKEKQGLDWVNNASSASATVTETTADLHLYADGDSGDDANSGTSPLSPKKTLAAVLALVSFRVLHRIAIHLSGTFLDEPFLPFDRFLAANAFIIIDGGGDLLVTEGPHTADISSVSSIGLSSLSMTVDEHADYHVEILDGPAAGERRRVFSNDGTTVVPHRDWSVDPGSAQFVVGRPATTFSNTSIRTQSHTLGGPGICFQRIYMDDNGFTGIQGIAPNCWVTINGVVANSSSAFAFQLEPKVISHLGSGIYDPDTFAFSSVQALGFSQLNPLSKLDYQNCSAVFINGVGAKLVDVANSQLRTVTQGTRVRGQCIFISNSRLPDPQDQFSNLSGYQPTTIEGAAGSGVVADSCLMRFGSGVVIKDHGSHGIEVTNSVVAFSGATTGSGNAGAGMRGSGRSLVTIADGSPPTLTGTIGDFSVDGTTSASTWAGIDGGTPVSDALEQTVAKEV